MRRKTIIIIPISRTLCLAVCWRECQYFQFLSCSSLHLSSPKTTMITLWSRSKDIMTVLSDSNRINQKQQTFCICIEASCYPTQIFRTLTSPCAISPPSPVQYCPAAVQSLSWCIALYWMDPHLTCVKTSFHSPLCRWADTRTMWNWSSTVSKGRIGHGSGKPWILPPALAAATYSPPDSTGSFDWKNISKWGGRYSPLKQNVFKWVQHWIK